MSKERLLTADTLRGLMDYDRFTGLFTWRSSVGGVIVGGVVGNVNSNGYMVVGIYGTKYRQHRLAWLYVYGEWPNGTIDHIDGVRTNNAIANLRDVSQAINMQNMRKATSASQSGILGVYFSQRRNGYMASVTVGGSQKRRGPYRTADRAQVAYRKSQRRRNGVRWTAGLAGKR